MISQFLQSFILIYAVQSAAVKNPFVSALEAEDVRALNELSTLTRFADLPEEFYLVANSKCKHSSFDSDLGEAVLGAVKLIDFFNSLDRFTESLDNTDDLSASRIMEADGIFEDMILDCSVEVSTDEVENEFTFADADLKAALLVFDGYDRLVEEVFQLMVAALAHVATSQLDPVTASALLSHAIHTAHLLLKRLHVKGSCRLMMALVVKGRLVVVHVGRASVKLVSQEKIVLFETDSGAENDRICAEVEQVKVHTYESVDVKAGSRLTLGHYSRPSIIMTF